MPELPKKGLGTSKNFSDLRRKFGAAAELQVVHYLRQRGYTIYAMNFSCRSGEIDIIARHADLLIIVEVKSRTGNYFPISAIITPSKQARIIKTAKYFYAQRQLSGLGMRFDVAFVHGEDADSIDYIENAFWGS